MKLPGFVRDPHRFLIPAAGFAVGLVLVGIAVSMLLPAVKESGLVVYSRVAAAPAIARAFSTRTGIAVTVIKPPGDWLRRAPSRTNRGWAVAWLDNPFDAGILARAGLTAGAPVQVAPAPAGVLVVARSAPFADPVAWSDLTKPIYRGVVGIADPLLSPGTMPVIAAMLASAGGWPQGQTYIQTLVRDGLHIYADPETTLSALRTGAIQIAIMPAGLGDGDAAIAGHSLRVVIPQPVRSAPEMLMQSKRLPAFRAGQASRFIAFVTRRSKPLPGLEGAKPLDPGTWSRLQPAVQSWFDAATTGPT